MTYAEAFKVITLVSDEDFAEMSADAPASSTLSVEAEQTHADAPTVGTQATQEGQTALPTEIEG